MKFRKFRKFALAASLAVTSALPALSAMKADYNFSDASGLNIEGRFAPMFISGADGKAWRTDGYTSRATSQLGSLVDGDSMSASLRFAIDTYTIIGHEQAEISNNNVQVEIASCLNDGARTGFGFFMGRTGKYTFKVYVGGELLSVEGAGVLPLWEWTDLTGVVNGTSVKLYKNGVEVGSANASASGVKVGNATLYVARANQHGEAYGAELCAFNGAFDRLAIYDDAITPSYAAKYADLNLPSDHYVGDRMRAKYHGQPGMNWTNETHGLIYNATDGKYHMFFQKTGSAPIMSHQHWGHIVSTDLVDWRDDRPVLAPGEYYDIKGCWSGNVFTDSKVNNGRPTILYTGVDFAQPYAAMAVCSDQDNMRQWSKISTNPLVKLNDPATDTHFRDTYFFRVDEENAFMTIGQRKAVQLYRYNGDNRFTKCNYNFYDAQAVDSEGFAEMPNVTRLANDNGYKWLLTTSPLASSWGTTCLYRIGDIGTDGKFENYSEAERFDFFSRDGYGLLSPTISTLPDGRTVALGIVADNMPTSFNLEHGFAHLYSLPRVISLKDGKLYQQPHEGIYGYRSSENVYKVTASKELNGTLNLHPVRGREAEVRATFTVGDATFGFNILKNAKGKCGTLSYNPSNREIKLDFGGIARVADDKNINSFAYTLPEAPAKGEDMEIHLFVDHTILDIFVNNRYAASVRVFPTDDNADLIEVFSNGSTTLKSLEAYILGEGDCSQNPIVPKEFTLPSNSGKVAFLRSAVSVSEQEQGALNFFTGTLKNSNVITTAEPSRLQASDFDCVWVHIDRQLLPKGYASLPSEFISEDLIGALKDYVAAGGNLMLTGHATQLLVPLKRINASYAPNEFNSGTGANGDDEWTVNPLIFGKYDHSDHPLYKDMEESDRFDWTTYGLLYGGGSSILREDHNCMWNLYEMSFKSTAADRILKFEEDTYSSVIGTWGQDRSDEFAGIVEFYPLQNSDGSYGGTIIANGLAACQWYISNGANADAQNMQLMFANTVAYVADKDGVKPENPGHGEIVQPEDPRVEETLECNGRVAMYVGYPDVAALSDNAEEQAAYAWFIARFGADNVFFADDYRNITRENYDCVWIHANRDGLGQGSNNLPDALKGDLFASLNDFVSQGGNLFLTGHATQIAAGMGRVEEVNIFGSSVIQEKSDEWDMNIVHHGNDWTSHIIFADMQQDNAIGHDSKVIRLMSGHHWRKDYNCMWNVDGRKDSFCSNYNCEVLGTWGHNGGQTGAGMVIFYPQRRENAPMRAADVRDILDRQGTIIANGLAAYQWNAINGTNDSHSNIEKLTSNVLSYLAPVLDASTATGVCGIEEMQEDTPIYFTLQGIRVAEPHHGVYIVVKGNKATKTILK